MFNTSAYDENPWHTIGFIIGLSVIVAIMVFLNVSKTIKNSKLFRSSKINIQEKINPDEKAFLKQAHDYSLSSADTKFLRELLKGAGRAEPYAILQDSRLLDEVLKVQYKQLAKGSQYTEAALGELSRIFTIRNTIAYFQDSDKADKHSTLRRYIRKEASISCNCSLVNEVDIKQNGKTVKKLVLTHTVFQGTIINISAGGCAIKSSLKIKAGIKLKIDFTLGKSKAAVLGEIIRINRDVAGSIFHIRFLQVLPKSFCVINAFIFDYN
jgi:hypothetical protein